MRVLPLIKRAEDHHGTVPVGRLDDPSDTIHVGRSETAVAAERGVHSSFVSREAALQTDRERHDAVGNVLWNTADELFGIAARIEVREVRSRGRPCILEDRVHHSHIHEQTFGGASFMRRPAVDQPARAVNRDLRSRCGSRVDSAPGRRDRETECDAAERALPPLPRVVEGHGF